MPAARLPHSCDSNGRKAIGRPSTASSSSGKRAFAFATRFMPAIQQRPWQCRLAHTVALQSKRPDRNADSELVFLRGNNAGLGLGYARGASRIQNSQGMHSPVSGLRQFALPMHTPPHSSCVSERCCQRVHCSSVSLASTTALKYACLPSPYQEFFFRKGCNRASYQCLCGSEKSFTARWTYPTVRTTNRQFESVVLQTFAAASC